MEIYVVINNGIVEKAFKTKAEANEWIYNATWLNKDNPEIQSCELR